MEPILTLTVDPTIDTTLEVDEIRWSGKNRATTSRVAPGGGGINVALAVLELGGRALAVHTAGGATGTRLQRLLDETGLAHASIDTGCQVRESVILVEVANDRSCHVVPQGSRMDAEIAARLLDTVVDSLDSHRYVVASGSLPDGIPDDFYAHLAERMARAGRRLVLDSSGPALQAALEAGVHLVKPNRREAAELTGRRVETFADAREVNETLLERGVAEIVVTTLGAEGAMVGAADGTHAEVRTPSLPRPVQSDAGAGDSFLAAMTLGLVRGEDVAAAARWGVAAAAAATMTPGGALCRREDAEALWRRMADGSDDA